MRIENKHQQALDFHASGKPGKLEITPTKPLTTQEDLALAYSPGVAIPCLRIQENPEAAYQYTAKGNLVAVISNGTAVLGLGNLGSLASKPVMEGKAVLFKRFADVDGFDIEINTEDVDQFVSTVELIAGTFGGINLEDIKAPECFIIEKYLKKSLNIPVFHDDQHGTAICVVAGLINAFHLTGRDFKTAKIVVNGAGAAAIACANLIKLMGTPSHYLTMVDRTGVIYKGRKDLNPWKEEHAIQTNHRTLADALRGADVALGLSAKGAFTQEMLKGMNAKPIIFAMANPDPEITPEEAKSVRHDAIVATGRSDYPNQVNNTLCFPYIFRGALDVRAREINDPMKIAAAKALAALARQEVHVDVIAAYGGKECSYGPDYIIPAPFDPRLMTCISMAVAKSAMESGVATTPIENLEAYGKKLQERRGL
jgi:malate dehydrogenase (oxaloacetate-decarboxylating)(NADP+)